MQKITLGQAAAMMQGKLIKGDAGSYTDSVAVDSRLAKTNGIFFALSGSITDGHNFIGAAAERGACAAVISRAVTEGVGNIALIAVDDTFAALQRFAKAYRMMFTIPYIAVTGSSGKTTTKDLCAAVLARKYKVHKTQGNLNSSTGVPLTVFDLDKEHEISVIEMSMSHKGEILGNADIVRPDCAVITNIGMSHIEFLGSQENIFKAKCEVFAYFNDKGILIYNADDRFLRRIRDDVSFGCIGCGIGSGDMQASLLKNDLCGSIFSVEYRGEKHNFSFAFPGIHNVRDCLSAIALGFEYGLDAGLIQGGLDDFKPGENRMQITENNGVTLINDTYNANPDAVAAAVDMMAARAGGRKLAVLGDMLELGAESARLHRETGAVCASCVDMLLTVGDFGEDILEGFTDRGGKQGFFFENKQALAEFLLGEIKPADTVLFKASRGVKLDEVYRSVSEGIN